MHSQENSSFEQESPLEQERSSQTQESSFHQFNTDAGIADVSVSSNCISRFRASLKEYAIRSFSENDAQVVASMVFSPVEQQRIRDHVFDNTPAGGAIVFRTGNLLSPKEFQCFMQTIGSILGPTLIEPGTGGSPIKRLSIGMPYSGITDSTEEQSMQGPRTKPIPLHTDGAYHEPRPAWIGLGKIGEWEIQGGASTILHIEEWEELDRYRNDPRAQGMYNWKLPQNISEEDAVSMNARTQTNVVAPIFDVNSETTLLRFTSRSLINDLQYHPGQTEQEREMFKEIEQSMLSSDNIRRIELSISDAYFVNNLTRLHGRDGMVLDPAMRRVVLRIRGFTEEQQQLYRKQHAH